MGKFSDALEKIDMFDQSESMHEKETEVVQLGPRKSSSRPATFTQKVLSKKNLGEANGKWDARLFKAVNKDSMIPEIFKTLRSRILHPPDNRPVPKTIMIASSIPKEGKTFVAANLGISFATGLDQHCLLVDCDLRQPDVARMLGVSGNVGLADYLKGDGDLSELIVKTSVQKLAVLPSGKAPLNPAELLGSLRMSSLINEISRRYDDRIVIFDSPPMLLVSESIVLAGLVDAVIVVVRRGKANREAVQKLIDSIDESKIFGIVFNDHEPNFLDKSKQHGYGYNY